jgi:hypothetical protein
LGNDVGGILVDNGSSADIITYELFKRMEFRDDQLQKTSKSLYGFGNKKVEALGKIEMDVSSGTGALMRTKMVTFHVVDISYAYKAIFDRGIINKFAVVIHMPFLCMEIPTSNDILTIYGRRGNRRRRKRARRARKQKRNLAKTKRRECNPTNTQRRCVFAKKLTTN